MLGKPWRILGLVADLEGVNQFLLVQAYSVGENFVNESKVYLKILVYFY